MGPAPTGTTTALQPAPWLIRRHTKPAPGLSCGRADPASGVSFGRPNPADLTPAVHVSFCRQLVRQRRSTSSLLSPALIVTSRPSVSSPWTGGMRRLQWRLHIDIV